MTHLTPHPEQYLLLYIDIFGYACYLSFCSKSILQWRQGKLMYKVTGFAIDLKATGKH